jgi:biotin-(acetyl-CoA carboxylase) ligase
MVPKWAIHNGERGKEFKGHASILGRGANISIPTVEERELLKKATTLMEELLETLEVMQDKELVRNLSAALKEAEEGKTRPLKELIRELGLEGEI